MPPVDKAKPAGPGPTATLTVKGQPITTRQQQIAAAAIQAGKTLGASASALQACIYAGMGESSLGADAGTDQNVWQANNPGNYGTAPNWTAMATAFFKGTLDFQAGGAIAVASRGDPIWTIANEVEANFAWISTHADSYAHQFPGGQSQGLAEAAAIVAAGGGNTAGGGTFGAGGTGTPGNQTPASLWTVGDPSNPDQDYWTTINQYGMSAQWYCFSDAETLFVADGIELMAQEPQAIISRLDPKVVHAECTYDNTAFQYTHTHTKKGRIQRRTALAKLTSPTQVSIQIICDIDHFRAGDTVYLKLFGPADGVWLIGDCTRSIYSPTSSLTLVQAMQPINAASGLPGGPSFLTGKQASRPTSGTVIAAMISEAATISNDDYPYVYAGGHRKIGFPDIGSPGNGFDGHTVGFDCSGAVAAVLGAGGILPWAGGNPGASNTIVDALLSQGKVQPGQGTGSPECTLFDTPNHIFLRLNGEFFGTSDGDNGNHSQPNGGAGWLHDAHSDVPSFRATHVPQAILGQQAGG